MLRKPREIESSAHIDGFALKMFKSSVYVANAPVGKVEVYPKNTNLIKPIPEIRISHLTQPSERCPPLAVLHTVGSGGVCFLMECKNQSAPLFSIHRTCITKNKTAVIPIGEGEIHLVAMNSIKDHMNNTKKTACFWGFKIDGGLYSSCLTMLNTRCLGIVFDLDETLIVANTACMFKDRIESLQCKIGSESDAHGISDMKAELKRYQEEWSMLKQYSEGDQVINNEKIYKVQPEVVPHLSDVYPSMTRPIIRLPDRGIILTRINPSVRDTSVLVKMRPGWEEIRSYLTVKDRKRFEVFVCTKAERAYALEMWRLLDPSFNLISSSLLLDRLVCVKAHTKKSLHGVFRDGTCHPKMALVIDDRLNVWDKKDQRLVHVVPAFSPYSAPQAEANGNPLVLHVARNVACSVRVKFFQEFDDGLLPQISGVFYEDDLSSFQFAPDTGKYLTSKKAASGVQSINSKCTTLVPPKQYTSPTHPPMEAIGIMPLTTPKVASLPVTSPVQVTTAVIPAESSTSKTSQEREEGEVPESEIEPNTRRRLLIMQYGQHARDTTLPVQAGSTRLALPVPPIPVPVARKTLQCIKWDPLGPVSRKPPYYPFFHDEGFPPVVDNTGELKSNCYHNLKRKRSSANFVSSAYFDPK